MKDSRPKPTSKTGNERRAYAERGDCTICGGPRDKVIPGLKQKKTCHGCRQHRHAKHLVRLERNATSTAAMP